VQHQPHTHCVRICFFRFNRLFHLTVLLARSWPSFRPCCRIWPLSALPSRRRRLVCPSIPT
jgi:hypothetical protein